jgi:DNA-binding winged helix-turn-helix (wHTH) protein
MAIFLLLSQICTVAIAGGQTDKESHTQVAMRMVGHQLMLSVGDSTSRILPIERTDDQYLIRFESEFGFSPDSLALVVDGVIERTQVAKDYIVEVAACETDQVVYSYEVAAIADSSVLACRGRDLPRDCYYLMITIVDPTATVSTDLTEPDLLSEYTSGDYNEVFKLIFLLVLVMLILLSVVLVMVKKKTESNADPNMIRIGEYRFNKRNMELLFGDERIELTSKECDLLQLLCDSTNDTVERETILKMVWGDEGDYVGRTLDVFISKLRKKLEADSNVRITNIRGIGYKLIVDNG